MRAAFPGGRISALVLLTLVSVAQPVFAQAPLPPPRADATASELIPRPPDGQPDGETPAAQSIDLPTALRLADADNPRVCLARERICEAWARVDRAEALWLPSLRIGASYNRHDGPLQDVGGVVGPVTRSALYAGGGAGAVAAASPAVPGVYANFHLADAIFQPLAARQAACAQRFAATAATNDVLLQVSLAYWELVRAAFDVAIAAKARDDAQRLAELTADYARTGQGLNSDADRAGAELAVRKTDVLRSEEALAVASARLAELLRLDPTVTLTPIDPTVAPIELVSVDGPVGELVAQALAARPELCEARYLVGQAVERMRRERYAVLVPSLAVGTSYGGLGGGRGNFFGNVDDRVDFDAIAYWEIRNLGFGDRAARAEAGSQIRQANLRQLVAMDAVAREVVEARTQAVHRRRQIPVAKEGVAAAVASQRRNLERIQAGQGLPIEVLQSNQALAAARRDYLRALIDYNSAQFTLNRSVGWPADAASVAPEGGASTR